MDKHLHTEIALLNRKGKFLRRLLIGMNDADLRRLSSSPSPIKVDELLETANRFYLAYAQRN